MSIVRRITNWLETHWVTPAYSGWLLLGLSLFFFGAATNTMAGWLYVISGVMFALLLIGAVLPARMLGGIRVRRRPIAPVSMGEALAIELEIENQTHQAKTLIQLQDNLPAELGTFGKTAIELISPQDSFTWRYECPTYQRGIYRWQTIDRRTAAPVGLFWCRRSQKAKAVAVVYPTVLPLSQCPILDAMGRDSHSQVMSAYQTQNASQDLTRTLRPYRWGDSMRLIHWRTSARYGDLRVRELETYTGGQEVIVALDNVIEWNAADFEQAVIAAASLYFYALRRQMRVSLWTALGQIGGEETVLETLAAVQFNQSGEIDRPNQAVLWLTQNPDSLEHLPEGSRWLLWQRSNLAPEQFLSKPGLIIQTDRSLQLQLQEAIS
ncbi:DUF58 domain-containing protein [Leptolyngbya sp. ST-U4]|uniref:DUF58 domain-containing protein n=1 Tax=Leptolyngbya sp. ST-U4 TaxID=2933912 RepID=UPI0019A36D69|nr:DUF58 domain-containing protein [Cyanobacteria bacterium FACHB-502]